MAHWLFPTIDGWMPRLSLSIFISLYHPHRKRRVFLHIGSPTLAFYSDERVLSCWDMFLHLDLEGSVLFFVLILWSSKTSLSLCFPSVNRYISLI